MSERLTRAEVDSDYHDLKQVLRDAGKGVHIEIRKEWDNSLDRLHSMALALASLSEGWVMVPKEPETAAHSPVSSSVPHSSEIRLIEDEGIKSTA